MTLLGVIAIDYGVDTDEKMLPSLCNLPLCVVQQKSHSTEPGHVKLLFFLHLLLGLEMHGRVQLSTIKVGGTSKGRLSEFFKKELRDTGTSHGKIHFLNRMLPIQITIIRLYFCLVELGCLKNSRPWFSWP